VLTPTYRVLTEIIPLTHRLGTFRPAGLLEPLIEDVHIREVALGGIREVALGGIREVALGGIREVALGGGYIVTGQAPPGTRS